jgi:hypothetical protein
VPWVHCTFSAYCVADPLHGLLHDLASGCTALQLGPVSVACLPGITWAAAEIDAACHITLTGQSMFALPRNDGIVLNMVCRRKSPAWFGLQRKHAELAVADVAYLDVMRDNCKARTIINHK